MVLVKKEGLMGAGAEHLLGASVVHMSRVLCDTFLCNLEVPVN